MHFIQSKNVLTLGKEIEFALFLNLRYDVMANDKFGSVLAKYLSKVQLNDFALSYSLYSTLVVLVRQKDIDKAQALS